jgi:hypothetical protein
MRDDRSAMHRVSNLKNLWIASALAQIRVPGKECFERGRGCVH